MKPHSASGMTLIEVLVTVVILAFGLLGLAGLQSKYNLGTLESYQRAQAVVLLNDMVERINSNRTNAASYSSATSLTSATILGTGHADASNCATAPASTGQDALAARDLCEWSTSLKGAAEAKTSGATSSNVGAMIGARGCIVQLQAPNSTSNNCAPGIYQVVVEWQGMHETKAPTVQCGSTSATSTAYGSNDAFRRAISATVTVAQTSCLGSAAPVN